MAIMAHKDREKMQKRTPLSQEQHHNSKSYRVPFLAAELNLTFYDMAKLLAKSEFILRIGHK